MKQLKAREFLSAVFGRDDDAAVLSRRNVLAGLGLVGAAAAATQVLSADAAQAKPLATPTQAEPTEKSGEAAQVAEVKAEGTSDATDLSAQYWRRRRRYWVRRRYFVVRRRRYWRRRYWY